MLFGGVGVVLEVFGELDNGLCVVFGVVLVFLGGEVVGVHGFAPFCVSVLSVYHMCTWCCQLVGWCVVSHVYGVWFWRARGFLWSLVDYGVYRVVSLGLYWFLSV